MPHGSLLRWITLKSSSGRTGQDRASPELVSLFAVVLWFLVPQVCSAEATGSIETGRHHVGFRILDLVAGNGEQGRPLTTAVWYPTEAPPKRYCYGGPTYGNIALDAPVEEESGPFPLLVFSHGYGGSGLGAVFFTERLAARGWIVAAPDHRDRHSAVRIRTGQQKNFDRLGFLRHAREIASSGPEDRKPYLYRLDELQLALDGMFQSRAFGKLIDRDRIAVGGHSFGGFTALGLCGTIPSRHDSRIKAVLLFSTGAGAYLFTKEELSRVAIPAMLFLGEREENQQRGTQTMAALAHKIYQSLQGPKYFLEVKGASHFSFNNRFTDTLAARLLSGDQERFGVIRKYSIAFLKKHVAGEKETVRILEEQNPLLVRYLAESPQP